MPPSFLNMNLLKATEAVVQRHLRARGGALPGTVVSYDSTTETCSVQPAVHRRIPVAADDELDEIEELPILVNVPVAWPRAQGYSLVGDLFAGDPVLLVCCDRDISGWRTTGSPSAPEDAREGHWSSVVALPGLQANVAPGAGSFDVPGDAAALASKVFNELDDLRTKLNLLINAFNFHLHAVSGAATLAPTAGTVPPGSPDPGDPGYTIPVTSHHTIDSVASDRLKLDT